LYCYDNPITQLSNLPDTLQTLNCSHNQITEIPFNLPVSLQDFCCSNNRITKIPSELKHCVNLQIFDCSSNEITEIPSDLQHCVSLKVFHCHNNEITKIPSNLPYSLLQLYYTKSKVTHLGDIDNDLFLNKFGTHIYTIIRHDHNENEELIVSRFNLELYYNIRHLQRRYRIILVNRAAKKIQTRCEAWLWKPICRDSKPGINVKIGYRLISRAMERY
jgi:Leucine-rich repeat (LRR) protein